MKAKRALMLALATGLLALGGWKAFSHFGGAPQEGIPVQPKGWICPMRCLGKVYDHPGECPVCHMKLNPWGAPRHSPSHLSPWEALGGKTAVYFRPYLVQRLQPDRILRVAGPMRGTRLSARLPAGVETGLRPGLSAMIMPPQGYSRPAFGTVESVAGGSVVIRSPRAFPEAAYALAEIRLPAAPSLAVPAEALAESEGRARVFVKRGESFVPQNVELLSRGESYVGVSGLAEGDVVAGAGVFWLEAQWRMDHGGGLN